MLFLSNKNNQLIPFKIIKYKLRNTKSPKFVAVLLFWTAVSFCFVTESFAKPFTPIDTIWHDVKNLRIEGRGWQNSEMESVFDRLPAKAKKMVRTPVWNLARNSTGLSFRFITDADSFFIKWSLTDSTLSMNHMPSTGVSGVDVYYKKGNDWFYLSTGRPLKVNLNTTKFYKTGSLKGKVEYLVNLPLYNGVAEMKLGFTGGSGFEQPAAPVRKPIVFYGTSITQGGCASRPGLVFTSIISRKINRPIINLGFSGNGRLDMEIGSLITELDADLYVIDCMRNLTTEQVRTLTEPFLRLLRKNKPSLPILLVDQTDFRMDFPNERSSFLLSIYQKFVDEGDKNIFFLEGNNLLGSDGEGTVDGVHPNDVGFMRMADVIQKKIEEILK